MKGVFTKERVTLTQVSNRIHIRPKILLHFRLITIVEQNITKKGHSRILDVKIPFFLTMGNLKLCDIVMKTIGSQTNYYKNGLVILPNCKENPRPLTVVGRPVKER